ncbi:MAG: hypothetical protein ABI683_14835 [Ginsengibacter sp.]
MKFILTLNNVKIFTNISGREMLEVMPNIAECNNIYVLVFAVAVIEGNYISER